MINFDYITKENMKEDNTKGSQIPKYGLMIKVLNR